MTPPYTLRPSVGAGGDPSVAYVRSTGNAGGAIGDPSRPFATAQQAYNAGARTFDLGIGNFGTLTVTGNQTLRFRGKGYDVSILNGIVGEPNTTINVTDYGNKSMNMGQLIVNGTPGAAGGSNEPGEPGSNAGILTVNNAKGTDLSLVGGDGGAAGSSDPDPQDGGAAGIGGTLVLNGSEFATCQVYGGEGGTSAEGSPGASGAGGSVTLNNSTVQDVFLNGGTGADGGQLVANESIVGNVGFGANGNILSFGSRIAGYTGEGTKNIVGSIIADVFVAADS